MIKVMARVIADEGKRDELRELLLRTVRQMQAEPGCIRSRVFENVDDPDDYTLTVEYESAEAREAILGRAYFHDTLAALPSMIRGGIEDRVVREVR